MPRHPTYFPGSKDCYFCDNPIEHLCSFSIIDKKFAKEYFPNSVYQLFRTTKLSLCDACANDCRRFYSMHIPKLMCETFNIDVNKINQNKKCLSVAKCLLENKCKPSLRPNLEKILEDQLNLPINDINLEELVNTLDNISWEQELGEHMYIVKNAMHLIFVVTNFFVEHKEKDTLTELGKMSATRHEELAIKKKNRIKNIKMSGIKRYKKSIDKFNKIKHVEQEIVGQLRKERHEKLIEAKINFNKTCDFVKYKQNLIDILASLEHELKILLENVSEKYVESISDDYMKKLSNLENKILREEFKHECFLNGNIEEFRKQELMICDTPESIISLDKYIEYRKKDYESVYNIKKRKNVSNDDLNDDFIPFKK